MATYYTPDTPRAIPERRDRLSRWLAQGITLNWYTLAFVLIFAAAVFTRFYGLGDRVMSHDESLHTYYSWELFKGRGFVHTPMMHGPVLFHVTALMYFLFGDNDFTARLYPAILGVLMVLFPLLFRRWLGRIGALLASFMILISPLLLYHHRYIREDTPSIFFTMVMVWATFMYLDGPRHLRRKARWLYIFSAALLLSLASKESGFMYVAVFGLFMTIYWVARLIQHFRRIPMKTFFYSIIMPALLAGVFALIMYIVLSIGLANYATLEGRVEYLINSFRGLAEGTINADGVVSTSLDFNVTIGWTLLALAGLLAVVVGTALWAFRKGTARLRWREIVLFIVLTLGFSAALIGFEEVSKVPSRSEALAGDPENDVIDTLAETSLPIVATWVIAGVVVAATIVAARRGWIRVLYRFPEFDIMLLMGSLILPWMVGLVTSATGASPVDYSPAGIWRAILVIIPLSAIAISMGVAWHWKRWLFSAALFYTLFVFFYTTMFTNPMGLATGMIGSLGYWLEQQGVRRGSQPQYYYQLIIMPMYEYLPIIGTFIAMLAGMTRFWTFRRERLEQRAALSAAAGEADLGAAESTAARRALWQTGRLRTMSFILFTSWWAVYNFQAYTLAGEKMPWLGTHLTLPMILVTAWYFGGVFERTDWAKFRQRGWLYLLLLPLLFIAVFQMIAPFLVGESPFAGLTQNDLSRLGSWLGVVAIVAIVAWLIYLVVRVTGWKHLRYMIGVAAFLFLSVLTFRTAWMAAFINYDYATEYLVYAHGAPGIKQMMEQIEELSRRTAGGMNKRFAWGGNSWPVTWYFRNLTNDVFFGSNPTPDYLRDAVAVYASHDIRARVEPLLGDRYYRFEYMRMWWPSWNYFNLNAQRAANALDFSPSNTQAAEIRRGIWDIFWARDYTRYGQAVGEDYSVENWNPGERLYFYVRRDIAQQVWNLGVGGGEALVGLTPEQAIAAVTNACTENWMPLPAMRQFSPPPGATSLTHPLDIAVAEDGRVYVAEEFANRISIYNPDGSYVGSIDGTLGGQGFQRPNSVASAPDGSLYIADTWNYRIGQYNPSGEFLRGWGQPGQFGEVAQLLPLDGFWGPRDVAVDAEGNVYVADTGNKRIRVYTAQGEHLRDIGSFGQNIGQLDEPSSVAISPDGRLYVADTWNQRVSVFALDGTPLFTFPVRGWLENLGNRPYLAFDPARSILYVTDPDAGRVLVYDGQGNCIGSFGQPTDRAVGLTDFQVAAGIAVGPDGTVYVSDSDAGRILQFPPFTDFAATIPQDPAVSGALEQVIVGLGDSVDSGEAGAAEVTPEVTPAE
jgi:uncharacterized protein (TIGR03663 family)